MEGGDCRRVWALLCRGEGTLFRILQTLQGLAGEMPRRAGSKEDEIKERSESKTCWGLKGNRTGRAAGCAGREAHLNPSCAPSTSRTILNLGFLVCARELVTYPEQLEHLFPKCVTREETRGRGGEECALQRRQRGEGACRKPPPSDAQLAIVCSLRSQDAASEAGVVASEVRLTASVSPGSTGFRTLTHTGKSHVETQVYGGVVSYGQK